MNQTSRLRSTLSDDIRNRVGGGGRGTARRKGGAWLLWAAAGLGLGVGGCSSPLGDQGEQTLQRSIKDSAVRELTAAEEGGGVGGAEIITLKREDRLPQLKLKPELLDQLDEMAGPRALEKVTPPLGSTLHDGEQKVAYVTLEHAVQTAAKNNLNVEFARVSPGISASDIIAAEAVFDWTFFADSAWSSQDRQNISGTTFGGSFTQRQVIDSTVGLRRQLTTGGQFVVQHQYTYTDNADDFDSSGGGEFFDPNPAHENNFVVQFEQPLLRNAGRTVNMAEIRLAENAERDDVMQLKSTTMQTVTDAETAYWQLFRSYMDLKILYRLYLQGDAVAQQLDARRDYDIKPSQLSDARAQVEQRLGDVYRAQDVLRRASDQLKVLMNDPELPVGGEVLLLPSDVTIDVPMQYSLLDAVNTAISNRPEVQRAILSLDDTSIRLNVADNARLPELNLRSLVRFNGLGDRLEESYQRTAEAHYVDYQIGVNFEQAIGNRAAEAGYRRRMLERTQAAIAYRNTLQGVVQEVKTSLRQVSLQYRLIEQERTARYAAAENVRTLQVEEETIQGLTADFLDLKLRRQEALAAAEQREVGARVDYNIALADLARAQGLALQRNQIDFVAPPAVQPDMPLSGLFPDYPEPREGEGRGK